MYTLDFQKKNPIIIKVQSGDRYSGIENPKLCNIIIIPKTRIEYMAPFLR